MNMSEIFQLGSDGLFGGGRVEVRTFASFCTCTTETPSETCITVKELSNILRGGEHLGGWPL
jgi:hypothetical protein